MKPIITTMAAAALCLGGLNAFAVITNAASGHWTNGPTWEGGAVPGTGDIVVIKSGTIVTSDVAVTVATLTVVGTLTHTANGTNDQGYRLQVFVSNVLTVATGGLINATGCGYAGGTNNGYGTNGPGTPGGGGFNPGNYGGGGGYGGSGGGYPGLPYGSENLLQPAYLGSGGGSTTSSAVRGGAGGGGIRLEAGEVRVYGAILAQGAIGENGASSGGGSGGSIWINTGLLSGNGLLSSDGGTGRSFGAFYTGGGGGGGRIGLQYANSSFTGTLSAKGADGGRIGGAGTICLKNGSNAPDLLIDNKRATSTSTAETWVDNASLSTMRSITIRGMAVLSHQANGTNDRGFRIDFTVPTLTVESNGYIDVAAKGYGGWTNAGFGTNGLGTPGGGGKGSGGGYGGRGGSNSVWSSPGGMTYGSMTKPTHLGSGGGAAETVTYYGGAGGGAIRLQVGQCRVDGYLVADGTNGVLSSTETVGGGSGGSIWISADTLDGTGLISAKGGNGKSGSFYTGSGGGGGRIAIHVYKSHCYTANQITYVVTGGPGSGGDYETKKGQNGTFFCLARGTVISTY